MDFLLSDKFHADETQKRNKQERNIVENAKLRSSDLYLQTNFVCLRLTNSENE